MNTLHLTLLALAAVFVALYAMAPRRPRFALMYLRYLVLVLASLIFLMPFIWLVCAAFKDHDVLNEYIFLPPVAEWSAETINLDSFGELFREKESIQGSVYFWQYIFNSLFLASVSTLITLFFCSLGGYALAKFEFWGKKFIMLFMLGSMMIPQIILLAPTYELIVHLGWIDSYLALIVPGSVNVFGMFLFRQAIVGTPDDIIEAGRIDGCGEFGIFMKLVLPIVRPMSSAYCLIAFLASWNSFIPPNIYIHTQSKLTLPVILNQYVGEYDQQYGVFLSGTLLAIIPPAILFFALQREFISGLTSGAVKG